MKQVLSFVVSFCFALVVIGVIGWKYLGPYGKTPAMIFIVPEQSATFDVPHALFTERLIRDETVFRWLYNLAVAGKTTPPGGYRLDGTMNAMRVLQVLVGKPDFVWVKIRPGLRKEQVGILLSEKLGWSEEKKSVWDALYNDNAEYKEGVYFPDTYLLPRDESAENIAKRLIDHFMDQSAPYIDQFGKQNVKWTTGIKIASLIEREAGGESDMPIISGVIWNRLDKGMLLQIDATIQYAKGNATDGWWPIIRGSDTSFDSPYNTYLHKGLPPTPIANPSLSAIRAAANPAQTDCLFYLHDKNKQIHCSVTYKEHVENIKTYLN